jgi:hypothetical protein
MYSSKRWNTSWRAQSPFLWKLAGAKTLPINPYPNPRAARPFMVSASRCGSVPSRSQPVRVDQYPAVAMLLQPPVGEVL